MSIAPVERGCSYVRPSSLVRTQRVRFSGDMVPHLTYGPLHTNPLWAYIPAFRVKLEATLKDPEGGGLKDPEAPCVSEHTRVERSL